MRSDEAILLFMGLNDLREVFGRAKIALWCSLSLDLHKMFLFILETISLAVFSPTLFPRPSMRSPGEPQPPWLDPSASISSGYARIYEPQKIKKAIFVFMLLLRMLSETREVLTSLPIWFYGNVFLNDNLCEKFFIGASNKVLAPHVPLLRLPREIRLWVVSWGNHGDNL